jgi:hypothetical protein
MRVSPTIESYHFGDLVVDGRHHHQDLIILPDRVLEGWWRKEGHALHPEDLESVFAAGPDLLVVGQGANGRMRVTPETIRALEVSGIEWVAQPTEQACQTYNSLCEQRSVAAALHLTC